MGNLSDRSAIMAVGDGQGCAAIDCNGIIVTCLGDTLAIEAELYVAATCPGARKGDVGRKVIVTRARGKAGAAIPFQPFNFVMGIVGTVGVAADAVDMGIGDRGKSGLGGKVTCLGYGGNRRVVDL